MENFCCDKPALIYVKVIKLIETGEMASSSNDLSHNRSIPTKIFVCSFSLINNYQGQKIESTYKVLMLPGRSIIMCYFADIKHAGYCVLR